MYDYSSNSNRSKAKPEEKRERRKSVVSKSPTIKEKSKFTKIAEKFLPVSLDNIGSHIFEEYVLPGIGNALVDTISYIFDLNRTSSSKGYYTGSSWRGYYRDRDGGRRSKNREEDPRADKDNSVYRYKDFTFEFRQDALAVLDEMETILDTYPSVSIADFYDVAGVTNDNYTSNKYGWTDLSTAEVVRARSGGYKIVLPKPRPLD